MIRAHTAKDGMRARPERRTPRGMLPVAAREHERCVAMYVSRVCPARGEARHLHVPVAYPERFALQLRIRRVARPGRRRARHVEPSRVVGYQVARVASMCHAPLRHLHLIVAVRYCTIA